MLNFAPSFGTFFLHRLSSLSLSLFPSNIRPPFPPADELSPFLYIFLGGESTSSCWGEGRGGKGRGRKEEENLFIPFAHGGRISPMTQTLKNIFFSEKVGRIEFFIFRFERSILESVGTDG